MRLSRRASERSRFKTPLSYKAAVPIVNERCEIVGWTEKSPVVNGAELRHADAERLVGPIAALYVQIENRADAVLAGAPPRWNGPWHCLALCSKRVPPAVLQNVFLPAGAVIAKEFDQEPPNPASPAPSPSCRAAGGATRTA